MGFNYEKANSKHNSFYDYSKVVYTRAKDKVDIICPIHGVFQQTPDSHYKSGCNRCGFDRMSMKNQIGLENFLELVKDKHENFYSYPNTTLTRLSDVIYIQCPIHGEFSQRASDHLRSGCKKCGVENGKINSRIPIEKQVEEFNKVHNNFYSYPDLNWKNRIDFVNISCPIHGIFKQTAINHTRGHGCPECGRLKTAESKSYSKQDFVNKADIVHDFKFDYTKSIYKNAKSNITITCRSHGDFEQRVSNHLSGKGCPKCINNSSRKENVLYNFLSEHFETQQSNRSILGRQELDIVVESKKLAIEYDGLYWHSEKFIDNDYHLNKTVNANKKGYDLVHVFEDEWVNKEEVVKSKILGYLGIYKHIIEDYNLEVKEVTEEQTEEFLNRNSLENYQGSVRLGLYNNEDLIQVLIAEDNIIKTISSKLNTEVRVDKLFNHYSSNHANIIVEEDKRWLDYKYYQKLGFKIIEETKPKYYYFYSNTRYKENEEIPDKIEPHRIYDCGRIKMES